MHGTRRRLSRIAYGTYLPFKPIGGIRKGRPNAEDLAAARVFAEELRDRIAARP